MSFRPVVAAALVVLLALVACADPEGGTSTDTTGAPVASDPASDTSPGEPEPELVLGPEVDPATFAPGSVTFVWQVDGALLLTNTNGTATGHLPGWTLDRGASDLLAAPVVDGPDGERFVVTLDGLVDPADGVPLSEGIVSLAGAAAEVRDAGGEVVATLAYTDPADVWISATGTVVGVLGGDTWDLEAVAPTVVEDGCRIADRHEIESPLLVCDDGARLSGGTAITAAEGTRYGWVTVGTTGDEVLATLHLPQGSTHAMLGSRGAGTMIEVVKARAAAIFYRASGTAWLGRFGDEGALLSLQADNSRAVIRDLPGVTDVAPVLR